MRETERLVCSCVCVLSMKFSTMSNDVTVVYIATTMSKILQFVVVVLVVVAVSENLFWFLIASVLVTRKLLFNSFEDDRQRCEKKVSGKK